MDSNHVQVTIAFRTLLEVFAPYIAQELAQEFQSKWWEEGVWNTLYPEQRRDLPESGEWAELVDSLDIQRCLLLFDVHWQRVFRKKLSIDHRTWAKELQGVRNKLAHLGGNDFSDDDTWRALDTISRLAEPLDSEAAETVRAQLRKLRYGSSEGSTTVTSTQAPQAAAKSSGILDKTPITGLPSWRTIMQPHPDVAQGRYKNAEFAADLAQVARGEGAFEYRDPVEFFARTYVTEGMAGLLTQALKRVTGKDGEPVIQLKTAFGGGKTHSMLALYHMMRGQVSLEKIPAIKPVLEAAGIHSLPRANVAVLVGTALEPAKSKRPNNMPGITINTLWGEMAAQLAESAGNPELYNYVKESDRKGVSPGSEALKNLFDACGPCLILMDELVSYAKKIYGKADLPGGSYDNFIAFIQEITEAARASKNSLVVASIPESSIEIGGEAGQQALETIEHTFGRMESIWKPVAATEGFEVVRRRLFLDCQDPEGRDQVCAAFSRLYNDNQADFPLEARELEYKERMISCYPIHPEIFDRLYEDWATLERFQRTRGVLRLMAAVIHELWMGSDASLLIMPGSIPLDVPNVRDELTRHLSEGWNALVDREVDGKQSVPYRQDQSNLRYGGKLASRRVARTVMLGSAPDVREMRVRGIEAARVRLGVVQPGENIADFNDALNTLQSTLSYLYTNPSQDRYWYDTRPTLRKTMEDRATQVSTADVEFEIEKRLRLLRKEAPFAALHICPASSLDVPDEQAARLVVLGPNDEYKATVKSNKALTAAADILNNRGNAPRSYRNTLAFVAPDQDLMSSLKQEVRRYLAWNSIKEDSETLNLDATQNRETENNLIRSNNTVDLRLKEAYCWLLIPYIDLQVDMKAIQWDNIRISGGGEPIVTRAGKKMLQNEAIITRWAPALLKMQLDKLLWKDSNHIQIKQLWDYLCTYCYLPRLSSISVLEDTIRSGVNSTEYFGLAAAIEDNRYLDLKMDQYVGIIDTSAYLVKAPVAKQQLAEDEARKRKEQEGAITASGEGTNGLPGGGVGGTVVDETHPGTGRLKVESPRNTQFFMSADLDNTRIIRDVQQLLNEVIHHITTLEGSQVKISLEVQAEIPQGTPVPVVRTVTENCATLRVRDFGFGG
jgi:predicted AAA+ superfamily ATPase